jgi:hypothetical protein
MCHLLPAEVDALERALAACTVNAKTGYIADFESVAIEWFRSNATLIAPTIRQAWKERDASLDRG